MSDYEEKRDEGYCEAFWHGEYAENPYEGGSEAAADFQEGIRDQFEESGEELPW